MERLQMPSLYYPGSRCQVQCRGRPLLVHVPGRHNSDLHLLPGKISQVQLACCLFENEQMSKAFSACRLLWSGFIAGVTPIMMTRVLCRIRWSMSRDM